MCILSCGISVQFNAYPPSALPQVALASATPAKYILLFYLLPLGPSWPQMIQSSSHEPCLPVFSTIPCQVCLGQRLLMQPSAVPWKQPVSVIHLAQVRNCLSRSGEKEFPGRFIFIPSPGLAADGEYNCTAFIICICGLCSRVPQPYAPHGRQSAHGAHHPTELVTGR